MELIILVEMCPNSPPTDNVGFKGEKKVGRGPNLKNLS